MNLAKFASLGASVAALTALVACSSGAPGSSISLETPGFFLGRVSETTMTGAYNPDGFSARQVQKLVAETCAGGKLGGFNTQLSENGLTNFAASCETWRNGARLVEFQRAQGSNVVIETTGSANGNITFNQETVQL